MAVITDNEVWVPNPVKWVYAGGIDKVVNQLNVINWMLITLEMMNFCENRGQFGHVCMEIHVYAVMGTARTVVFWLKTCQCFYTN